MVFLHVKHVEKAIFHFTVTTVSNENSIEKALCLLPGSKFPALLVP